MVRVQPYHLLRHTPCTAGAHLVLVQAAALALVLLRLPATHCIAAAADLSTPVSMPVSTPPPGRCAAVPGHGTFWSLDAHQYTIRLNNRCHTDGLPTLSFK